MKSLRTTFSGRNLPVLCVAALLLVALPGTARATNLVANPSFEDPPAPNPFIEVVAPATIGAWSVDEGSVDHIGDYWEAADGVASIDMNGTSAGRITQNIATVAGTNYRVSFSMSGNPACDNPIKSLTALWNGVDVASFTFDASAGQLAAMGWTTKEFHAEATGTSTPLSFRSDMTGGSCGPAIDKVEVIAADAVLSHITVGDVTVMEGDAGTSTAVFPVTISSIPAAGASVSTATADATAKVGPDYASSSGPVSWAPGDPLTKNVSVTIAGDLLHEGNEAMRLNLTSPVNAVLADNSGAGTIVDEEGKFAIYVNDAFHVEGDAGNTNMVFELCLNAAPVGSEKATVKVKTAANTTSSATATTDYVTTNATKTFTNATGMCVPQNVPIVGDTTTEPDELLKLNLSANSANSVIADTFGLGEIVDNDTPGAPPPPHITVGDVTVVEGNAGTSAASFPVTISSIPGGGAGVSVATADGTAKAGPDYQSTSGSVSWVPGDPLTKSFSVNIAGDLLHEGNEAMRLNLASPVNAVLADSSAAGTIVDEEGKFSIYVNDASAIEPDTGANTPMTFRICLNAAPVGTEKVTLKAATGANPTTPATSGGDFTAVNATKTFTSATGACLNQPVSVIGDAAAEANELLKLNVTKPSANAVVADLFGLGTILDDD